MAWGVAQDRITVIYNAVALPDGLAVVPAPLATSLKLVTAGRLVPPQRGEGMIEAGAGMNDDVGRVVIGDGPERRRLESRVSELGLKDRVCFAGAREQRETLALMAACDIFVLNSTYEGLPHVVLEAMALGLPVVATDAGGTPELIQHGSNGLLLPTSGRGLTDALAPLLANKTMRRSLSEGAQRTAKTLCFASMLERTER